MPGVTGFSYIDTSLFARVHKKSPHAKELTCELSTVYAARLSALRETRSVFHSSTTSTPGMNFFARCSGCASRMRKAHTSMENRMVFAWNVTGLAAAPIFTHRHVSFLSTLHFAGRGHTGFVRRFLLGRTASRCVFCRDGYPHTCSPHQSPSSGARSPLCLTPRTFPRPAILVASGRGTRH
jgi:hypothetical protein